MADVAPRPVVVSAIVVFWIGIEACTGGSISTGTGDGGAGDGGADGGDCGPVECPAGTECVAGDCLPYDPCRDIVCETPGDVCAGGFCVSGAEDRDGDGFPAREDCDDGDPAVFPGVVRPCVNGCGEGRTECQSDGRWSGCAFEEDPCALDHADSACVGGACVVLSCDEGWDDCDELPSSGCEAELGTPRHCSGCGDRCADEQVCDHGVCRCIPDCDGVACGAGDGCGGRCDSGSCPAGHVCESGSCRCVPDCRGATCGAGDGCGGRCASGSCPAGSVCEDGSCRCVPDCSSASCGDSDGCGGRCDGDCPPNERCRSGSCECPGPHYRRVSGRCVPSCGVLLDSLGLYDDHGGCCGAGCRAGIVQAGGPGDTWDCSYCCEGDPAGSSCR